MNTFDALELIVVAFFIGAFISSLITVLVLKRAASKARAFNESSDDKEPPKIKALIKTGRFTSKITVICLLIAVGIAIASAFI